MLTYMKIGIPKEIKNNEFRVSLTPAGALELSRYQHEVIVETNAGLGAGYSDEAYRQVGALIVDSALEVYNQSEMIVKVKEPLSEEYSMIREDHIVFTYFHFVASKELTDGMITQKATCIAYETVQEKNGSLPLLIPMSMVAGRLAVQEAANYLLSPNEGKGKLMGGVPGVAPANVMILGGGIVGTEAAKMAAGLGASVTIFDINGDRLRYLSEMLPKNVSTLFSNSYTIEEALPNVDVIIGAVLIPGGKAPHLIKESHLQRMTAKSILIDVAVDQGGCIETCRPTTHANPVYFQENILHYGVANMPGAVPQTATRALTNATLPYVIQLANKGWKKAIEENVVLERGVNIVNGEIIHSEVKSWYNTVS